jgi:hypothetical protein
MHFKKPDHIPVQYYYCPVGYYEHGDKLNDLYAGMEGDFAPFVRVKPPSPPASDFDAEGKYHAFKKDEWGVLWEYRIYGVTGIPKEYPLADPDRIASFTAPILPAAATLPVQVPADGANSFYRLEGCGSLYERMIALRPEAEVLCDIISDEPYIHKLADSIIRYDTTLVERAIASGADGIAFGDDYGTERAMLMSPALWRSFFKPLLSALFKPAVAAGLDIHFHSCGYIWDILDDFAEIGVTSIWPQLPIYDMGRLAAHCRELGLAIAIHTDRARTMTYGSPSEVRELVLRECETFKLHDGGGWFYIEADYGFTFANLEALVNTIKEFR